MFAIWPAVRTLGGCPMPYRNCYVLFSAPGPLWYDLPYSVARLGDDDPRF